MKNASTHGLQVRVGLRAGAVVCYDTSFGYLTPINTPCSTPDYFPPAPNPVPPDPNIQWLNCQQCSGTNMGNGRLAGAKCEVCYT